MPVLRAVRMITGTTSSHHRARRGSRWTEGAIVGAIVGARAGTVGTTAVRSGGTGTMPERLRTSSCVMSSVPPGRGGMVGLGAETIGWAPLPTAGELAIGVALLLLGRGTATGTSVAPRADRRCTTSVPRNVSSDGAVCGVSSEDGADGVGAGDASAGSSCGSGESARSSERGATVVPPVRTGISTTGIDTENRKPAHRSTALEGPCPRRFPN